MSKHEKALAAYEAMLAQDPENRHTLRGLFELLLEMKRYPEAITTCERLAESWRRMRFHKHAVIFYVHAYALLLDYVPHLNDRFGHLPSRLAETFAEIMAEDPQHAAQNMRFTQDALATRSGREVTERALIDILRKVIDIAPSNPLPRHCLVDALVRVGDVDEAKLLAP